MGFTGRAKCIEFRTLPPRWAMIEIVFINIKIYKNKTGGYIKIFMKTGKNNQNKRKKYSWRMRAAGILLLSVCLGTSITALAADAGSEDDPLVTLSYLNGTFLNQILEQIDQKIAAQNYQNTNSSGFQPQPSDDNVDNQDYQNHQDAGAFAVVTLSDKQVLTGKIGCEVMLRIGSATCVSDSTPGLIDETSGSVLENSNALVRNHLYMMTIDGRGIRATTETVKLMVRGGYQIS